MISLSAMRKMVLFLRLFQVASRSPVSASESKTTTTTYQVRSNFRDGKLAQQEQDQRREFVITFSDDGTPIDLPLFKMNIFPTNGALSDTARRVISSSFSDYLLDGLTDQWSSDSNIQLNGVTVQVLGVASVEKARRRLQTGSEIAMQTTLTFDGTQSPPSDKTIEQGIKGATNDLSDYTAILAASGVDELENVQSASFKDASNKLSDAPTAAPVGSNNNGNGNNGNGISQANAALQSNTTNAQVNIILAGIAGLAVFMLTVFFIAHRRRTRGDLNDSSFDESFDEKHNISMHTGSRPGKDEIEVEALQNLGMDVADPNDGRTTLHIPAMMDSTSRQYTQGGYIPRRMLDSSVGSYDERAHAMNDEGSSNYTSDYSDGEI